MGCSSFAVAAILVATLKAGPHPQSRPDATVTLVVEAGRPLQVSLDRRLTIKRVGQPVTGTLVQPLYAYDRVVIPGGAVVRGRVQQLIDPSRFQRVRAWTGGDFSPHRRVVVQFDSVVLRDGSSVPIGTRVTGIIARPARDVAASNDRAEADSDARRSLRRKLAARLHSAVLEGRARAHAAVSAVTSPGKLQRLRQTAIDRLPYHPQSINKGTVFALELTSPIGFGAVTPIPQAPIGTAPAPASVVDARLVTAMDSAKTARGTPIVAVVTVPVFSRDHRLILPEGTRLTGEVTLARKARRFHHNGQLRFLFERVQVPDREPGTLLASLHSIDTSADAHVAIDDEGGARVTSSKARFVAPALAILSLRATMDHDHFHDADGDPNDLPGAARSGRAGPRAVGSFLGFRVAGLVLGQLSRPVGIGFTVLGVARTLYTNVIGRGHDVSFPADTTIQLQLAPGPPSGR